MTSWPLEPLSLGGVVGGGRVVCCFRLRGKDYWCIYLSRRKCLYRIKKEMIQTILHRKLKKNTVCYCFCVSVREGKVTFSVFTNSFEPETQRRDLTCRFLLAVKWTAWKSNHLSKVSVRIWHYVSGHAWLNGRISILKCRLICQRRTRDLEIDSENENWRSEASSAVSHISPVCNGSSAQILKWNDRHDRPAQAWMRATYRS